MKKISCFLAVLLMLGACNSSYGDKYEVNKKSTIYYTGGLTAGDAKLLGDFLLQNGYFDSLTEKTIQLAKEKDTIIVKFVEDEAKLSKDAGAVDANFIVMGTAIGSGVFPNNPLKIILADPSFKGYRDFAIPRAMDPGK
jgi:hypothetical protein